MVFLMKNPSTASDKEALTASEKASSSEAASKDDAPAAASSEEASKVTKVESKASGGGVAAGLEAPTNTHILNKKQYKGSRKK